MRDIDWAAIVLIVLIVSPFTVLAIGEISTNRHIIACIEKGNRAVIENNKLKSCEVEK